MITWIINYLNKKGPQLHKHQPGHRSWERDKLQNKTRAHKQGTHTALLLIVYDMSALQSMNTKTYFTNISTWMFTFIFTI